MAVYPDRIVLKNSTDAQASIESLIGAGGTDEILPGEIVIGRESGSAKAYVLDADGNIVAIGGGSVVASINDLTDADTSTDPPQGREVLGWDGTNWRPFTSFGTYLDISGFTEQVGTTTDYPLAGSSTHYADLASMEADGWTYIVNTTYESGSARSFDPGVNWDGIDFLGNGITSGGQWFINTSGGVGWDNSSNTTNLTSNDISVLSNGIDFYVSLWNEGANNGTVRAGWKEHVAEGRTWLVVRLDSYYGASITGGGYVTETWFGQDGSVSVRISPKFGTNNLDIGVFTGRNTIGSNGSVITGVANPFTGMDQGSNLSSGDYAYNLFGNPFPRNDFIENLGDVNLTNLTTGDGLQWDGTEWINATNAGGGLLNVVEDLTPQLGGELDVNGQPIITAVGSNANVIVDPDGTGVFQVSGNTDDGGENDGTIQLNCSANTHGVKIKSPPHSAGASYTLTLPTTTGNSGEVLTTDGTGALSWSAGGSGGSSTLLGLTDVYAPNVGGASWTFSATANHSTASGMVTAEAYSAGTSFAVHPTSIEGDQKTDLRAWVATLPATPLDLTLVIDGVETAITVSSIADEMDLGPSAYQPRLRFSTSSLTADAYNGSEVYIKEYNTYLGATEQATDGDIIQWVAANNRWEATALPAVGGATALLDLTDVYAPNWTGGASWSVSAQSDFVSAMNSGEAYQNASAIAIHPVSAEGSQLNYLREWVGTLTLPTTLNFDFGATTLSLQVSAIDDTMDQTPSAYQPRLLFSVTGLTNDAYVGTTLSIQEFDTYINSIARPADGDFIRYVAANDRWETTAFAGGGGATAIDDLTDVDTTTNPPATGQVLKWDGTSWVPGDDLQDGTSGGTILIQLDSEGSGDLPVSLSATGMTSTYPSTDAYFGSGGATFLRSNADFLSGTWVSTIGTNRWTLSFWVKTSDTDYGVATGKRIIAPQGGTNLADGFQIMRESAGGTTYTPHADNLQGAIALTPGGVLSSYLCSTRTTQIADGSWHYVVMQHEGSGVYSCFVDGALTERRANGGGAINFGDNSGFFIGKRADNNADAYFTGSLDNMVMTLGSALWLGNTTDVPTSPDPQPVVAESIDSLGDVDTSTVTPTVGQVLKWDGANWVPGTDISGSGGSATLGRGDGGDFDAGTVDGAFVFGVYGGGDLDTTSVDAPVELIGGADGGDIT